MSVLYIDNLYINYKNNDLETIIIVMFGQDIKPFENIFYYVENI